ncbi:hypothetical protein BB561_000937 [Smittium simulii]|uniref:Uncharacterized protein n=1 Tax=Smittium simulii TaxID=133385 RepID=A0A2T9YWX2_9FUNG|nr:hypothetical protein BB561_000937 [Smittium simulii]
MKEPTPAKALVQPLPASNTKKEPNGIDNVMTLQNGKKIANLWKKSAEKA